MQGTADRDRTGRRERPRIVIVGGGFSGVEVAGKFGDFLKASRRRYPQGDVAPRVVIVHGGAHLMSELPERLGRFTERKLGQGGGVEIRLNTRSRVTPYTPEVVEQERALAQRLVGAQSLGAARG